MTGGSPTGRIRGSFAPSAWGSPLIASLLIVAAALGCDEPISVEELARVVNVAETAWVVMDRTSFEQATSQRREMLRCAGESIDVDLAIQLHLQEALAWSLERRSDLSQAAFRAILALRPGWELPMDIAPERHRLRDDFEQVRLSESSDARRPFESPGRGNTLFVDGSEASEVPVDRPFVAQIIDARDVVVHTHYFTPGSESVDGLSWIVSGGASDNQRVLGAGRGDPQRSGIVLMGSGAGVGLLAGGLYLLAASRVNAMESGELDCDDLGARRRQVNELVAASAGVGVLGVGLGVAGVVVHF